MKEYERNENIPIKLFFKFNRWNKETRHLLAKFCACTKKMPVRSFFAAEFFPAASFEIVLLVDDNS